MTRGRSSSVVVGDDSMSDSMSARRAEMNAERLRILADGQALADALRSWDLRGHELHGLRPWRTCRLCFRMSFAVFVEWPARDRWRRLISWLRPVVIRAGRRDFVTREWRWSRRAVSQRTLW